MARDMSINLEKAKLIPAQGENAAQIEFMYNPTDITFTRTLSIQQDKGARSTDGNNKASFAYPNPYTLKINRLILDTYENKSSDRNVLKPLKPFTDAVAFAKDGAGKQKRTPIYIFTWGQHKYLRCFITSFTFKLTMFLPDGTPVRAEVDLTLEQVDENLPKPAQTTPNVGQSQRESGGRSLILE